MPSPWNLGVQHVFARDYTFEARYIGTRGIHLLYQLQLNRAAVVTPTHFLPTYLTAPSQATLDALPLTLTQLTNERLAPGIGNTLAQYGFTSNITAYVPAATANITAWQPSSPSASAATCCSKARTPGAI